MVNHKEFRNALDELYGRAYSNSEHLEDKLLEIQEVIRKQKISDYLGITVEDCRSLSEELEYSIEDTDEEIIQDIENLIEYIPEDDDARGVIEINIQYILKNSVEESDPIRLLSKITSTLNENNVLRPPYIQNGHKVINFLFNSQTSVFGLPASLKITAEKALKERLTRLGKIATDISEIDGIEDVAYDDENGEFLELYIGPEFVRTGVEDLLDKIPSQTKISEEVNYEYRLWETGRALPNFNIVLPEKVWHLGDGGYNPHPPGGDAFEKHAQGIDDERAKVIKSWEIIVSETLENKVQEFDKLINDLFDTLKIPIGPGLDKIALHMSKYIPNWFKESKEDSGTSIIANQLNRVRGESIHNYNISDENVEELYNAFNKLVDTIEELSGPIFALHITEQEVDLDRVLNYEFINGDKISLDKLDKSPRTDMINSVIDLYKLHIIHNTNSEESE